MSSIPTVRLRRELAALSFITLAGFLGFFGTLQSPFLYDDQHAIAENPYIRNLTDFQEAVGIQNIFSRSVLLFTFAVNRAVGGLNTFGYHLVNILLHIGVAMTAYFLTKELIRMEGPDLRRRFRGLPLLAAFIHLFNPVTVQSVTYLSSRSSLLATFFYVLGFYYFVRVIRDREHPGQTIRKTLFSFLSLACFVLGLGSKAIVVTLPLMAVVYLNFSEPAAAFRKNLPRFALIFLPLVLYLVYRKLQMGSLFTLRADPVSALVDRHLYFLTQIKLWVFYYLQKLFLPINLNFEPDVKAVSGFTDGGWLLALGFLGLLAAGLARQKSRLVRFAFIWTLITLLPTSSIIPLKQLVTEHRAYLPGLGISLVLGIALSSPARFAGTARWLAVCFITLAALLTLNRTLDYRTEILLWEDTGAKSPNKAMVHNNLASAYLAEKQYDAARRHLETTLRLNPQSPYAFINLGFIHARKERWDEARAAFDKAISLGTDNPEAFFNAGLARRQQGDTSAAIPLLKEAARLRPLGAKYHYELGNAYRETGLYDQALTEYRLTLQSKPDHAPALNNIGVVFWKLKAITLAVEAFNRALALQENLPEVRNNLAGAYLKMGLYQKAVPHLERLIALQPENSRARELLRLAKTMAENKTP